jgi:hypothetical protein
MKSRYLYSSVRTQVEVELGGMCDAHIDGSARRNVVRFANLILLVDGEQSAEKILGKIFRFPAPDWANLV